jgi:hypothetical protein
MMPVNDIQVLCMLCVWRFKSNGVSALNGLLSSINPARHKTEGLSLEPYFSHLIIPIDLKRIWNRL